MGGIAETSVAARGVRRVMVPCGRNTGVAPPIVWHTCTWTCEHAGLADLVGSRPHGRHRGEVGWRTRSRLCDVRVHRSTDCGTNVNTVPRMGRQQERSEGVLVSVDYIRSRPPSARMDKHDGGRLMGMRPRREGATGGGRVYGNTMWRVFVRSFPSARVCS